jgi:hypothetical protein
MTNSLRQATHATNEDTTATHNFTEALHLLRPVLTEAGVAAGGVAASRFGELAIAARGEVRYGPI